MFAVYIIAGLALIIAGANILTDGSAALAKRFNLSNLVIGLTVVAFGTSTPELVVSVFATVKGSPGMAIGNVVGSNIFNTLLIIGCTAAIVPLRIAKSTVTKEIPLCLLASIVLFVCAQDIWIDGGSQNVISRTDGFILLSFFAVFIAYVFAIAANAAENEGNDVKGMSLCKSVLFIGGGLAGLIFGGQLFVEGSTMVARHLGVSESVIGLTLVAGGTSLPELATSVVAALKKKPDMAVGNAIGSNIFNIFFILGCSATITPLAVTGITRLDFLVMIGACIILSFFSVLFKKSLVARWEGIAMVGAFVAYMTSLIANA